MTVPAATVVRYADVPDTPWPNGGGMTRLLWRDPAGDRRISVATLVGATSFSSLPGMVRILIVLDPVVIDLQIDDRRITLRAGDRIDFGGDAAVALLRLDRPGRVLNVMSRADRWIPSTAAAAVEPIGWVVSDDLPEQGLNRGDLVLGPVSPGLSVAVGFSGVPRSSR